MNIGRTARQAISRRAVAAAMGAMLAVACAGVPARAEEPISASIERLSAALSASGRSGFAQRSAALEPAVDGAFDLDEILRQSVGPRWEQLSPDDQAKLAASFRRYTIASYAANLAGEAPKVSPETRALPNGDQVVDTDAGGTKLSYVMRRTASGWKAVDVLADGSISRVAVQRSDFRAMLEQGGGAALVASLDEKTSRLAS